MELFNLSHLHALTQYLHVHPYIGGLIAFGISFLESIPIIGGIIPGSVMMTAVGALIGSGAMPMVPTIAWAISGAFIGDFFSYGIGAYYNERLKTMWPFRRYPQWLVKGKDFFDKHGGKSILIGRFFGPVRGIVPLIAGLMHLPILRFILSAVIAAILWSVVYIFPGIIVGALSLELPPATATKFILTVLALVAFGWIIFVLLHIFLKKMLRWADRVMDRIWQYLQAHRFTSGFTALLSDSNKHNQHRQLTLAFLVLLSLIVFSYLFYCVLTQSHVVHLNIPIFEFLRSIRTRSGDDLMLVITLLGDKQVQLIAGLLIFGWLMWKRHTRAAWHWLALILLSAGALEVIKTLYYSPRPPGLLHQKLNSSFPSGHSLLAAALFMFLAMLLSHHLTAGRRKAPLVIAAFLIFCVGFSRLYLGNHWFVDVLAGWTIGLGCALGVNLFYLRRADKPLPVARFATVAVSIFAAVWCSYTLVVFQKQQENHTLYWPTVTMDNKSWWEEAHHTEIPLFILSRLGKPKAALNVQWLGDLEAIQHTLLEAGWQAHGVDINWKGSLHRLSAAANPQHLPVLPSLYQNQSPVLMMTKQEKDKPPLYFVLWKSNVTLLDSNKTLWIGSVYYFIPRAQKNALALTQEEHHHLYAEAMTAFMPTLDHLAWKIRIIPLHEQPAVMCSLDWDGKLLLVQS